ncbi:hypothetical protein [Deinococcus marmoris]|uniref:Uncharacterized protein n=1 Tax=Deinococcus marmoris TaxID=249408 RepID=A0A1U7P4S5_9DEIO|nr:hypothetical protein [Deinococcus marmoris]OLV20177.1 hypothetical protein BOO71_0000559 [Deinococcus marmoris]
MRTRTERRATANARHIAPAGAMSMATERLIERTPAKHLAVYANPGTKRPQNFLNHSGAFSVAGRSEQIAAYAGGAIIAHLPRSQAHRHLPHMKRR